MVNRLRPDSLCSLAGTRPALRLSISGILGTISAALIFVAAAHVLWKSGHAAF